jgi:hypothetical protein
MNSSKMPKNMLVQSSRDNNSSKLTNEDEFLQKPQETNKEAPPNDRTGDGQRCSNQLIQKELAKREDTF